MTMSNLLRETIDAVKSLSLDPEKHIDWVGSLDGKYQFKDWEQFKKTANKEYNNKTLTYRVAYDLVIVLKDGRWLERFHDAATEYWKLNTSPQKRAKYKEIKNIWGQDQALNEIQSKKLVTK